MPNIYFIQYLRPNGRKEAVSIDRPDDICAKADSIKRQGFRFECETLTTDDVSLTISDDDGDYSVKVVPNGSGIPVAVDELILEFDLAAAIKQREINRGD